MDNFSAFSNIIYNQGFLIFMIIVGGCLLWIYLKIPKIVKETEPKVINEKDHSYTEERDDSIISFNKSSLLVFSIGLCFSIALYFCKEKDGTILKLFFQLIILICFVSGGIMQILNRFVRQKFVKQQEN